MSIRFQLAVQRQFFSDAAQQERYHLEHFYDVIKERALGRIVWALPRRFVFMCFLRVVAHGTTGQYGSTRPDTITALELMDRWVGEHTPSVEEIIDPEGQQIRAW